MGQPGRTLKQRIIELKQAVKNGDCSNGLAVHVTRTKHRRERDEVEVICKEEQWMKQKIKESLKIKAHGNNLNLFPGDDVLQRRRLGVQCVRAPPTMQNAYSV